MNKKTIGITGSNGFLGWHLTQTLRLLNYSVIAFPRTALDNPKELDALVEQCETIVHLAAVNRHENLETLYQINISIAQNLADSLHRTHSKAQVIMSSSTQEELDNLYGKSKKEARLIFENWANNTAGRFSGLIIPNVFGPFGLPFYNSVIATFCYQLSHGDLPKIINDNELKLIYIDELVKEIIRVIENGQVKVEKKIIEHTHKANVSTILQKLITYKDEYLDNGIIPNFDNQFEINLFNTYRSFIDHKNYFPFNLKQNIDPRGKFVEIIKLNTGGQVSFSTTKPGITRGNHFHTRKIERFAVIKGQAKIEMRKIGSDEKLEFDLNGDSSSYVDMPVWYTHNIINVGEEELFTIFWINEMYNPEDADTYMEVV